MTKHTPAPWVLREDDDIPGYREADTVIAGNITIYQHSASFIDTSEQSANSARIVECVNALEGLNPAAVGDVVEALEGLTELAEEEYVKPYQGTERVCHHPNCGNDVDMGGHLDSCPIGLAIAALAKLRGE